MLLALKRFEDITWNKFGYSLKLPSSVKGIVNSVETTCMASLMLKLHFIFCLSNKLERDANDRASTFHLNF